MTLLLDRPFADTPARAADATADGPSRSSAHLYELADERTRWRHSNRLRFVPAYRDGRLVTLDPLVRASAFAGAYGGCRAMDWVFHAATGATHVSAPVALLAGTMAALSSGTSSAVRRLDATVMPRIAPVADAGYRAWHSRYLAPLRAQVPGLRGDLRWASLLLATGAGRFAAGFASVLAVAALASVVSPVPAGLVITVATVSGVVRWGFPYADERYGLMSRLETAGSFLGRVGAALPRAARKVYRVWSPEGKHVRGAKPPQEAVPSYSPPEPLDDACPFAEGEGLRYRHLSLSEVRRLTESVAGPCPPRAHPDRPLWLALSVTLKKTVRGRPGRLWVMGGEGAPERIADLLGDLAGRAASRGEPVPGFDLSSFGVDLPGRASDLGRATAFYTASAVRLAVRSPIASPAELPPAVGLVPVGARLEPREAHAVAARLLGVAPEHGEESSAGCRLPTQESRGTPRAVHRRAWVLVGVAAPLVLAAVTPATRRIGLLALAGLPLLGSARARGSSPVAVDAAAAAVHATAALLESAVQTREGLRLEPSARRRLEQSLCERASITQVELLDTRAWEPSTARGLQQSVSAHLWRQSQAGRSGRALVR